MLRLEIDFPDRRCDALSTGMKQKVSIARTLVHDPPVMIFDEPTSGLDVMSARAIIGFIRECREQGKTVLFSTHVMSEAEKLCDTIGIIHDGCLKTEGTLAELRAAIRAARSSKRFSCGRWNRELAEHFMSWQDIYELEKRGVVYRKELTDSLRDRRTVMSMVLVPILLMPLLTIGAGVLAALLFGRAMQETPTVMVLGGEDSPKVAGPASRAEGHCHRCPPGPTMRRKSRTS